MNKRELAAQYISRAQDLIAQAEAEERAIAEAQEAIQAKEQETVIYEQAIKLFHDGIKPIANPDNPYPVRFGLPVIPNMHYLLNGKHYTCMPIGDNSGMPIVLTEENLDDVMYTDEVEEAE